MTLAVTPFAFTPGNAVLLLTYKLLLQTSRSAQQKPMPAIDAAPALHPSQTPNRHRFGVRDVSTCFAGAWNHTTSFFTAGLCGARATPRLEGAQSSPQPGLRGLLPGLSPRNSTSEAASPGQVAGAVKKASDFFRSNSLDASASAMIQATFRGAKGREEVATNRTSSNKPGTATPDLLSGRSSIKGASCMVQAAGHAKTFQRDPESPGTVVIKEGTANERVIYEALQAETLRDFAPSYHGAVERGAITLLRLGNMTAGCSAPCVMDVKLGTRRCACVRPQRRLGRDSIEAIAEGNRGCTQPQLTPGVTNDPRVTHKWASLTLTLTLTLTSFVEAEANNSKMRHDLAQKIADLDLAALLPREVRADRSVGR